MNIKYYYYVDMQNTVMPAKNVFHNLAQYITGFYQAELIFC